MSRRAVASGALLAFSGLGTAPRRLLPAPTSPPHRIAFVPARNDDAFFATMRCGIEAATARLHLPSPVTQGPDQWDPALQARVLRDMVQARPDAVIIAPLDPLAMMLPIQHAIDAGVAVVTVDTLLMRPIALANVGSDQKAGGRFAANILARAIGGRGSVLVVDAGAGLTSVDQREEGFRAELMARFRGIRYLGPDYCSGSAETAANIVTKRLQSEPDLAGIFGTFGDATRGIATALRQAGPTRRVQVVGFDAGTTEIQDLRDNAIDMLVAQHPAEMGETAVQIVVEYLRTGRPPAQPVVRTGFTAVTRTNVDTPAVRLALYVEDCAHYAAATGTPVSAP